MDTCPLFKVSDRPPAVLYWLDNCKTAKEIDMNVEVTRLPPMGTKVLYADGAGVLHARPYCETVAGKTLTPRIPPRAGKIRCEFHLESSRRPL